MVDTKKREDFISIFVLLNFDVNHNSLSKRLSKTRLSLPPTFLSFRKKKKKKYKTMSLDSIPCASASVASEETRSLSDNESSICGSQSTCDTFPSSVASSCDSSNGKPLGTVRSKNDLNSTILTPPCTHNTWFRVRKMRGKWGVLLRCQICNVSWPTKMELHEKCPDFYSGCCTKGGDCPSPHIYARGALPKVLAEDDVTAQTQVPLRCLKDERRKAKKAQKLASEEEAAVSEKCSTMDASSAVSDGLSSERDDQVDDVAMNIPICGAPSTVYRHNPYADFTEGSNVFYY